MNIINFKKYGEYFDYFLPGQLDEILDFDEIELLPDNELMKQAVFMLCQIMIGRCDETAEALKIMPNIERQRVIFAWSKLVKCADELKGILQVVSYSFI